MIHNTRETSTYIIIIVHEYVTCTSEEEPILPYMEVATIFGRLMSACAFRDIDYTLYYNYSIEYRKLDVSVDQEVNPNSQY